MTDDDGADGPRPVTAADYRDLTAVSEPRVHPDGDRVAFVRTVPDGDEDYGATVYVADLRDADGAPDGPEDESVAVRRYTVAEGVDSQPRFSPSGDRLAFVSTRGADDDRPQLWVLPLRGGEARQVTTVAGGVSGLSWSPDGDRIAFAQSTTAEDRRENRDLSVPEEFEPETPDPRVIDRTVYRAFQQYRDGKRSHVYLVDLDAGDHAGVGAGGAGAGDGDDEGDEVRRITDGDRDHVAPAFGDADTLYYVRTPEDVPDPDDSIEFEVLAHDLTVDDGVGPDDGASADGSGSADGDDPAPTGDGDGTGADDAHGDGDESTPTGAGDAHGDADRPPAGAVDRVVRSTGYAGALTATGDGRVAYPYLPEDRATTRQTEVHVHDRTTGRTHVPTAGLDRTLGYDAAPEFGPGGEFLYFGTPDRGSVVLRRARRDAGPSFAADPDSAPDEAEGAPGEGGDPAADDLPGTPAGDPEGVSVVAGEGRHVAGAHGGPASGPVDAAFVASSARRPGDVFAVVDGETCRLTGVNDGYLADRSPPTPEPLAIEGPDGALQGWLLVPTDAAVERRRGAGPDDTRSDGDGDADSGSDGDGATTHPLVVEIHGGPHVMWSTAGTVWHEFRVLADRGYAVFWSNPRGSAGYGEQFMRAITGDWGATTMADVEAGIDHVLDRPEVDDGEVYVTGGSFGGFMTAWAVGHSDRFRAAVSQRGVYDLAAFYGTSDAYRLVEDEFDAYPWTDAEYLHGQSPSAAAAGVTTPTLLIHSDRDYRTPAATAEMFYRTLRKVGTDTRMVRYPREGHELSRSGEPAHVVDRIERIARWFDGYSAYSGAPRALDRARNAGLSAGDDGAGDDDAAGDDGAGDDGAGGDGAGDDDEDVADDDGGTTDAD